MRSLLLRTKKLAQKGQGSIEYIGIAVIAAIVIAGIISTPIKGLISDGMAKVICQVTHGADHYSAESASPTPPLVATVSAPGSATVLAGECPLVSGKTDGKSKPEAKSAKGKSSDSKKSGKKSGKSSGKNSSTSTDSGTSSGSKSDSKKDSKDSSKSGKKKGPVKGEPVDVSPQGFEGPFVKGEDGTIYDKDGNKVPNSKPNDRPSYGSGQVETVWKQSRDQQLEDIKDGKLKKDHNGFVPKKLEKDEIYVLDLQGNWRSVKWKPGESRQGKWDMGHLPGEEYRKTHRDYLSGKISREEFLEIYRDPNNYKVEDDKRNRSGRDEDKSDQ